MRIVLLSKKIMFMIISFLGTGFLDYYWLINIDHKPVYVLFAISLAVQFYLIVEAGSGLGNDNLIIDFRSREQKLIDEETRQLQLIEGLKNNLIMKIGHGEITSEEAAKRFSGVLDFYEEKKLLNEG